MDEQLRARLVEMVDSGRRQMAGGSITSDGKTEMWGNEPIMVPRNPDGAAALAYIDKLTADAEQSEKHRNDLADKVTVQSVEIGALKAEMERRDTNEMRNCVNWGPCSRHDDSMTEGKLR